MRYFLIIENPMYSIEQRVDDLISRMTLGRKAWTAEYACAWNDCRRVLTNRLMHAENLQREN